MIRYAEQKPMRDEEPEEFSLHPTASALTEGLAKTFANYTHNLSAPEKRDYVNSRSTRTTR
jgi:hypothetical protein